MQKNCFLLCIHSTNKEFFEKGLLVTVKSLKATNPGTPIVIFHDNLIEEEKSKLAGCELIRIESSPFHSRYRPDITDAAFFRFYLHLLGGYDRVLYLDSDLVVLDSLEEVFRMRGNIIARGVRRKLKKEFLNIEELRDKEKLREGGMMFNSGVICFDRAFWQEKGIIGEAQEIAARYGMDNFKNPDQAILNIIARRHGGFTRLPDIYNYCRAKDMEDNGPYELRTTQKGFKAPFIRQHFPLSIFGNGKFIKILHWNGVEKKPWRFDALGFSEEQKKKYYYECYRQFTGI